MEQATSSPTSNLHTTREKRERALQSRLDTINYRRKVFNSSAAALEKILSSMQDVVEVGLRQIRRLPSHGHVKTYHDIAAPPDFDEWTDVMEWETCANDIKTDWRVSVIYHIIKQVDRASHSGAKALTALDRGYKRKSPRSNPAWSYEEEEKVIMMAFEEQGKIGQSLCAGYFKETADQLDILTKLIKEDYSFIDEETRLQFPKASPEQQCKIIEMKWEEATNPKSARVFEQSWHRSRMRTLRTLTRMHLSSPMMEVEVHFKQFVEGFQQDFRLSP